MKTIKYITLSVVIMTMVFGGFNLSFGQGEAIFSETYRSGDIVSLLGNDDPLIRMADPSGTDPSSALLGFYKTSDAAGLLEHLQSKHIKDKLPSDVRFAWGRTGDDGTQPLYTLKRTGTAASPSIEDISEISIQKDQDIGTYDLLISFSEEGALKWAKMTRDNTGRDIAIIVDDMVVSAPRVQSEIKFGKCRISGDLGKEEAAAMKMVLEHE